MIISEMEFEKEFEDLCRAFGKNNSQIAAMCGVFYEHLKNRLSYERLLKVFSHLIENHERFPTLREIIVCSQMFPEARETNKRRMCVHCEDGIVVTRDKEGYRAIWKCVACNNCPNNYPEWNDDFYMQGYTREVAPGWDGDDWQLKGLIMMGTSSMAYSRAPQAVREKVQNLIDLGWKPKGFLGRITL